MRKIFLFIIGLSFVSCLDSFLEKAPLDSPSSETFWTSADDAEMWVNHLYVRLPNADNYMANWSDNGHCRTKPTQMGGVVANSTYQPNTQLIEAEWDYITIRGCLDYFDKIETVPNINKERKDGLTGQVRFILAFKYFWMMTLYRDIPLVKQALTIEDSDVPKSPKSEVLTYVLEQVDKAIDELPLTWPESETGRATKGAALALKARVLLYNERWAEAASTAKQLMDLNLYELHPNFGELFIRDFNNQTKEVILAYQHADVVRQHDIFRKFPFFSIGGWALCQPTPSIMDAFECVDGLPINESPLYDPKYPSLNRDPRCNETLVFPFTQFNEYFYFDPFEGRNPTFSLTKLHFKKYVADMQPSETESYVNWILFRYAEVLLTYAEAKNEESGPDNSIFEALDLIRIRAGMPTVDRDRYNTKEKLRILIRNERRVELVAEGHRYFDIIRWRIAENVLTTTIKSVEIPGKLDSEVIETRVFNPNKHYVWPIPQYAIDRAKNLEQHPEWK